MSMAKQESIDTKMQRIAEVAKSVAITLEDLRRADMKILDLSLTYHWYDEIEAGRKPEEYRSNTPFYRSRLMYPESSEEVWKHYDAIRFRRGRFGKRTMLVEHKGTRLGVGNPEWGAPEDKEVFILELGKVICKEE